MKIYSLFFLIILVTQSAFCVPVDSISQQLGGHIREMKVYTVTPKRDPATNEALKEGTDSALSLVYRYDKAQHLMESISGDGQGNIVERMTFKYNDKGLKSEEVSYAGEGQVRNRETFKYDDFGNVTQRAIYENGKEMEKEIVYKYNKAGKEVSKITRKEETGVINKMLSSYDAAGNLAGTREYDWRDSLITGYDYKYDARNNRIEEIRFSTKGEEWKYQYAYTPFNMKEKEVHLSPYKTSNSTTVWLYDTAHNVTEEIIYDYNNKVIQKSTHKFIKGKLVADEANNAVTEYEYDAAGNKVKEKVTVLPGQSGSGGGLMSERTYDKKGNLHLWTHYSPPGIVAFIEIFQYNESGKPVKYSKQYKDKSVIEQTESRYDSKGNIIEEISKNEKLEIIRKTITVYQYFE